ncbi:hypothetical protein RB601_003605 [Gaeumannomyces tritici]
MGEFLPSPRYTGGGLYGTIVYTSPCDVRRRDSTSSRKKPTPQPRRWCSTPLHEKPVPQEPVPQPRRPHSTSRPRESQPRRDSTPEPKQPEHRAAAEKDARKHWTPEGYSLTHWDPTEQPILLLGSVFDANSLGKWIYDWTVCKHGKGHPIAQIAGELWLLLIEFSGKIKGADEIIPSIRQKKVRKMVKDFINSGDRLTDLSTDSTSLTRAKSPAWMPSFARPLSNSSLSSSIILL